MDREKCPVCTGAFKPMSEEDKELNAKKEQARIDATRRRSTIVQAEVTKKKVEPSDKKVEEVAEVRDDNFLHNLIFGDD